MLYNQTHLSTTKSNELNDIICPVLFICCVLINEISFELQMETISVLMIFAVVMLLEQQGKKDLKNSGLNRTQTLTSAMPVQCSTS